MSVISFGVLISVILSVAICVLVVIAIVAIVIKLISDKKKGKSQCGGDCYHCSRNGTCH